MHKQKQLFLLTIFLLTLNSCASVIKHNQEVAAVKAIEFAKAAIIDRDFEKASKLLPVERQNPASIKQLEDLITKIHPTSYPTKVTAIEYEPMHGQKAIKLFLVGENNQQETFYYTFILAGTVDEGYGIIEVYRSRSAFPPSQTRKALSDKRSTDG